MGWLEKVRYLQKRGELMGAKAWVVYVEPPVVRCHGLIGGMTYAVYDPTMKKLVDVGEQKTLDDARDKDYAGMRSFQGKYIRNDHAIREAQLVLAKFVEPSIQMSAEAACNHLLRILDDRELVKDQRDAEKMEPREADACVLVGSIDGVLENCPELNMCNYNEDDVNALNEAMKQVVVLVEEYKDRHGIEVDNAKA